MSPTNERICARWDREVDEMIATLEQIRALPCAHPCQSGELRIVANGYTRWLVCDDCHETVRELEPVVCEHTQPC